MMNNTYECAAKDKIKAVYLVKIPSKYMIKKYGEEDALKKIIERGIIRIQ